MPAELLNVPAWWKPYVVAFVQRAYPIGTDLQVTITSWQRSVSHNAAVRGAEGSQHLVATAWDVSGPDQDEYARRAAAAGLVVIDEGTHIHVQLFKAGVIPERVFAQVAVA